ncbi:MAG: carbohydrate kinase [Muribaculaceae bacterium]|nr:carbohydrate kinase [Muribaculaceae bacterium]
MYLLGYDLGTSSVKAALVDAQTGKCVASDFFPKSEAPIKSLKPGWAEQNPSDWLSYLKEATKAVIEQAGISPSEIKAIGLSYQMHGLVAIDKDGNLLRDSIIWCDSRGVPYGEKAFNQIGKDKCLDRLLNSPGNFTASKLMWVKENEPHIFEKIYKVMLPADYVAYKLTGEICTNPEGLSEYMLWDFKAHDISEDMLKLLGTDRSIFPEIKSTFCDQGKVTPEAAKEFGLASGIPVTYRAGDQPNNALSLNVFEPGEIASTAGTSGVVYGINEIISYDNLSRVNNFAHVNHTKDNPRIGVMTCISGTGILNSWMKRNIAGENMSYSDMNDLAATAPVGCDGLSILPFGNGAERVLENRQIGCSFNGINFNIHTRAHLFRGAQEGIVFSLMYGMEIMQEIGMKIDKIHAGHANMFLSPVFRETLASVSGATIELFDTDGAVGAARGAGLGAGIYSSPAEAFATLAKVGCTLPAGNRDPYLEAYNTWKEALRRNL